MTTVLPSNRREKKVPGSIAHNEEWRAELMSVGGSLDEVNGDFADALVLIELGTLPQVHYYLQYHTRISPR